MLCIEAIPPTGKPVGFLARLFMTEELEGDYRILPGHREETTMEEERNYWHNH